MGHLHHMHHKLSTLRSATDHIVRLEVLSSRQYSTLSRFFSYNIRSQPLRTCKNCSKYVSKLSAASRKFKDVRLFHQTVSLSANEVKKGRQPLQILFFGTDPFSVRVLQILDEFRKSDDQNTIMKLDVLSNPGETRIRGYASSAGLRVLDWPVSDLTGQYNVGVLASFGHLIPSRVISMFDHGILNVHPSLLPRWRGASPIVHTILSGDQTTGVTIMKLRPKHFDTGPVMSQKKVTIPESITSFQLRKLLAEQGGQLLLETLQSLGDTAEEEQTIDEVTYAHKLKTWMTYVNWEHETCEDVKRHYRAFGEFLPLRSEVKGQTVKLLGLQGVDKDVGGDHPGSLVFDKRKQILCVRCKDGWIGFEQIVIKKTMTAQEFYNGYLSKMADKKMLLTSVQNGLDKETYNKWILQKR